MRVCGVFWPVDGSVLCRGSVGAMPWFGRCYAVVRSVLCRGSVGAMPCALSHAGEIDQVRTKKRPKGRFSRRYAVTLGLIS